MTENVTYVTFIPAVHATGFEPDLILVDDANQASLPALFVLLTEFKS